MDKNKRIENLKRLREGYIIELQQSEDALKTCTNKVRGNIVWRIKEAKKEIKKLEKMLREYQEDYNGS